MASAAVTIKSVRRARVRRWLGRAAAAAVLGVAAALGALWALTPELPPDPAALLHDRYGATQVLARDGAPLALRSAAGQQQGRWVEPAAVAPTLVKALITAEDQRFGDHLGVDPLAIARAARANWSAGRIVSGASTIPQQLARMLDPGPRSWRRKAREAMWAMALTARYDADTLLGWYLSVLPYGGVLRGVESASQAYFGRSAAELSPTQAALLAVVPRNPEQLDLRRHPRRALPRAHALLHRLHQGGAIDAAGLQQALAEEIVIHHARPPWAAPHAVAMATGAAGRQARAVATTLDADLQRALEGAVSRHLRRHPALGARNAALVVLDAHSGDVLALVGSQGWSDVEALGANNGVLARRQPGSALKPLVYALALDRGLTPATVLHDIETSFHAEDGWWRPDNYGARFHGPVRARVALGNSLNVPALVVANRVGLAAIDEGLRAAGIDLGAPASHHGLGVALGNASTSLLELAGAVTALATDGRARRPRLWLATHAVDGAVRARAEGEPQRVVSRQAAWLVSAVLRDRGARAPAFPDSSAVHIDPDVAVKTGTSKGYRDAVAVGWDARTVVAVWVGNFDGRALADATGATAAAPLLREAWDMLRDHGRPPQPAEQPSGLVAIERCSLSGLAPTSACEATVRDWAVPPVAEVGHCTWHRPVAAQADEPGGAPGAQRVMLDLPAPLRPWARGAGWRLWHDGGVADGGARPVLSGQGATAGLRFLQPADGDRFWIDSAITAAHQGVRVLVESPTPRARLRLAVDGRPLPDELPAGMPRVVPLPPGSHAVRAWELDEHGQRRGGVAEVRVEVLGVGQRTAAESASGASTAR